MRQTPTYSDANEHTARLVRCALAVADPADAIESCWPAELRAARQVTLIAMGKASVSMARRATTLLGDALRRGVVLCPPTHADSAASEFAGRLDVFATDHPLPTARSEAAARQVAQMASRMSASETLLALVSGGASAQLSLPREGVTIDDLAGLTQHLLRAGADIHELNTVRKHAEQLKGGGLARLAHPARVHSLIVSDVVGNDPATVSSGPTAPDPTTFADALMVLDRYDARRVSPSVTACLVAGTRDASLETPGADDSIMQNASHEIVASNETMIELVCDELESMGFVVADRRLGVQGEASRVGGELGREAVALGETADRPSAIVWGGETTVSVGEAPGSGGRNQELGVAAALAIESSDRVVVLSLATDGVDGPTDAAGAVVTGDTAARARALGVRPEAAIEAHDTHPLLDRLDALIRTGPTGVNVIDLMVALIYPPDR